MPLLAYDSLTRSFRGGPANDPTNGNVVAGRVWFYSDEAGNLSRVDLMRTGAGQTANEDVLPGSVYLQTETQGLVLLEALASSLPVLAISALGTRSIVDPGRGVVAAATTPDGFARQLVDLLASPQRLSELAAEGLRFAREWGADRPAQELASLYRTLVARRASLDPQRGEATRRGETPAVKAASAP
jgi:hypothetical protein